MFRAFDAEKDIQAVRRIWIETGWIKKGEQEENVDLHASACRGLVAGIVGEGWHASVTANITCVGRRILADVAWR